jgi:FkbM family methyltransferase
MKNMTRRLIIDVGMHNGDDTHYYLHRGFNVLAIEADPTLVEQAKERFSEYIKDGRLQILNIGIADIDGEKDFYICDSNTVWNTFNKEELVSRRVAFKAVKVSCKNFEWVLKHYGIPFYLKIDIEGNDYLCIDALSFGNLPKYISTETWGANTLDRLKILDMLHELGYTKFKCISQFNFIALQKEMTPDVKKYQKIKQITTSKKLWVRLFRRLLGIEKIYSQINKLEAKFRTIDEYVFPEGSSGPFGEDTPGNWMNINEIKEVYKYYLDLFTKDVESIFWIKGLHYSFWTDFHASKD